MEELLIKFILGFDLHALVGTGAIVWFLTKGVRSDVQDIKNKIIDLDKRLENIESKMDDVEKRLVSLQNKVDDTDKRLVRIETMLHVKDCCMLKDSGQIKKAE